MKASSPRAEVACWMAVASATFSGFAAAVLWWGANPWVPFHIPPRGGSMLAACFLTGLICFFVGFALSIRQPWSDQEKITHRLAVAFVALVLFCFAPVYATAGIMS